MNYESYMFYESCDGAHMMTLTACPAITEEAPMTTVMVLIVVASLFSWAVHDLQAFAEQYVSCKHAND